MAPTTGAFVLKYLSLRNRETTASLADGETLDYGEYGTVIRAGVIKMSVTLKNTGVDDIIIRFMKNDATVDSQTHASSTWTEKTYDMTVAVGDVVHLQFEADGVTTGTLSMRNAKLLSGTSTIAVV